MKLRITTRAMQQCDQLTLTHEDLAVVAEHADRRAMVAMGRCKCWITRHRLVQLHARGQASAERLPYLTELCVEVANDEVISVAFAPGGRP